jgi:predicted glycogen debranching enzyme
VDASLWYAIVVAEWMDAMRDAGRTVAPADRRRLGDAVRAILDGFARGTRYGIRADADGLLAAGVPGVQLTWMDAKIGDWVVTPRVGKPVEVQALWVNALDAGARFDPAWAVVRDRARAAFEARFWNEDVACLFDVVDVDHEPGRVDGTIRPNQLFALGALPVALVEGERARRAVDTVERALWTPLGPRSLAPGEPGYAARYAGGVFHRDSAYHQGTVWPWLAGPFVDAWLRVRGDGDGARREARERFVAPLLEHLHDAGLGHVSEIADADAPHHPNGCPFQAWSVGELLRLEVRLGAGSPTPAG